MTDKEIQKLAQLLLGQKTTTKVSITEAFNNFISLSKINCREDTIDYYVRMWEDYVLKFLNEQEILFLNDVTTQTLLQLQLFYKSRELSNNTVNKLTDLIKMVYKSNYDHEFIEENPIRDFKKLKADNVETIIVQEDIRNSIMKYLDTLDNSDLFNVRNKLIVYILDETGARLSELLSIERKNVFVNENLIYLAFTKTGEPRYVCISDKTRELIKNYLARTPNDQKYFFLNLIEMEQMSKVSIYKFLDKLKAKLKIKQSITPHKWRHTLATNLMNNNVPIREVQKVLGHTQLSTTQKYLHSDVYKTRDDVLKILNTK